MQESDFRKGQHKVPRGDPYNNVKVWLDNCLQHHSSCSKDTGQFRPSRLLDLGSNVGENDIRLIVSELDIPKQKGRQNHYATLSYCWGPPGLNARTTKENIGERRRKIPLDSLPRTVRDAVKVTRELGIRYLWVDALCIIQEDKDDWARESAVMGQIYRRSLCTLAAAIGNDCNAGLFARREAAQLSAGRILVELSTLSTRGWVMQERILAARTIFFTEEGIFWQCADRSSSEFNEKKRDVEARPWHNLVFEFTQRDLTQPNDRLRAVEGIANEFAESANDIYVNNGGIWKSDMIGGMAWYRQWDQDSNRLSIAPSWSWASVSGQIISMYQRTGHVVNIAEVNWKRTKSNKIDQRNISIQELHILGNVCQVKLYRRFDDGIFWAIDSGSESPPPPPQPKKFLGIFNRQLNWDQLSGIKAADGINGNLGWSGSSSKVLKNHYEIIFDSSTENPGIGTEFLCMPLVGAGFQAPSAQVFPSGLILVPVDAARKVYRRLGWCFMWASVPDEKLREVELVIV
ncbi:heterokaryon incompatibility protein-domain-containing protein [Leptodontidium sp. 2 PMI_412]|nr:heterokaryon incompatibility protein-domain-containing protein [Leptodontidium sp. 2 PMI_412]